MVNEGLAIGVNRARQASWIDEAVLLAFLLLAFVGLSPFAVPPPAVTAFGGVATTGAGDLARQLCYLAVFAAIVIGAARTFRMEALSLVPVLLVLLLAWCLLSALWSGEPGVTLRRAGLAVVLVISAMSERGDGRRRAQSRSMALGARRRSGREHRLHPFHPSSRASAG